MQILDVIRGAQGGQLVEQLGRQYGLSPEQSNAVLENVIPQLSRGIERNTLSRGGLADLVKALGQGHHAETLNNPRTWKDPAVAADGNDILGHILGSKDASRGVIQRAAGTTGISESIIKMMLPILAQILMGGMSKGLGGGLGDILGKMGGGAPTSGGSTGGDPRRSQSPRDPVRDPAPRNTGGDSGFELPQMPSSGGVGIPMPDGRRETVGGGTSGRWGGQSDRQERDMQDRDAQDRNIGGGFGIPGLPPQTGGRRSSQGGSPLPLPGETVPGVQGNADNPYGDLSDIIRRGASRGGGQGGGLPIPGGGGGGLWGIVRGLIGGALGFGNRGVMGWIFNLLLMRFGWPLLRAVLGKVLLGR
jgi:hypothetical protein